MPVPRRKPIYVAERKKHEAGLKQSKEKRKKIEEMLKKKRKPWDIGDVGGIHGDMTATKTRLKI